MKNTNKKENEAFETIKDVYDRRFNEHQIGFFCAFSISDRTMLRPLCIDQY